MMVTMDLIMLAIGIWTSKIALYFWTILVISILSLSHGEKIGDKDTNGKTKTESEKIKKIKEEKLI